MNDHLKVNDVRPRIHYHGDGSQLAFSYPFALRKEADLKVYLNGAELQSGYTVEGIGASLGGLVRFDTAPPSGARVTLIRQIVLERTSDFQADGIIRARTLNDDLDALTMMVQQVQEIIDRAVKLSPVSVASPDLTLPDPIPHGILRWSADGQQLELSQFDPDTTQSELAACLLAVQALVDEANVLKGQTEATRQSADVQTTARLAEITGLLAQAGDALAETIAHRQATAQDLETVRDLLGSISNPLGRQANLSDLADVAAARANLGLGSAALAQIGSGSQDVPTCATVLGLMPNLPAGVILPYGGTNAPSGYLFCQGQTISRSSYAALFAAIGVTYGAGNGSTTFKLPDLRGRVPVGAGQGSTLTNRTLGQNVGAETHTLSTAEMPSHTHVINAASHSEGLAPGAMNTYGVNSDTVISNSTGGGQAHNNMQPSLVLNYIIKI